jgi:serine/threonine-protein kinase
VVNGWCLLYCWREDAFSVSYIVEREGVQRTLRLARYLPDSPEHCELEQFLEREVGALQRVQHPSIIRLHEEGRWRGYRYLMVDHVDGYDFTEWPAYTGATYRDLGEVMLKIMRALEVMQEKGVFHNGISPYTMLVRKADGVPVLIDFSLASWEGNPLPRRLPFDPYARLPKEMAALLRKGPQGPERGSGLSSLLSVIDDKSRRN